MERSSRPALNNVSLQMQYAPKSICFGCGPANEKGLQIGSFLSTGGDRLVARFKPELHHQAFRDVLNGGIIGALLDCHCNWTASYHLMKRGGLELPPCTVTADYSIALKRPTPTAGELELEAWVVEGANVIPLGSGESNSDRVQVEGVLKSDGKICATCKGTFVAVKPGHPAYHRW
jgi:acyl-coenzyme A thioesterase PaaI-like protein